MTYCTWQPDGELFVCPTCGTRRKVQVRRVCRTEAAQQQAIREYNAAKPQRPAAPETPPAPRPPRQDMPSLAKQGVHFAAALIKWMGSGMQTRTPEEIDALLAICVACEHYDAERERCTKCGCCSSKQPRAWRNKLAMASEKCPVGKW